MHREPITPEGLERLREELKRLKTKDSREVISAIAEARAHGDLKENGEYHAAREKQGLLEAHIAELENTLAAAQVIDHKKHVGDRVVFGSTVTVLDVNTNEKKRYQIVGKFESDIKAGKIPVASPIAKALVGRKIGEQISLQIPKGLLELEIEKIEFI